MSELKENESCSITWVDPKTVVEPYSDPKPAHQGPKNTKITLKIKSNSNVRI